MYLDALISDRGNPDDEKYDSYITLAPVGFWYQHARDSDVRLYAAKGISFHDVLSCFLDARILMLNSGAVRLNKKIDCCISLFFYPYFPEFYDTIKREIEIIPRRKLKYLRRKLLAYLADPMTKYWFDFFSDVEVEGREWY